MSDVYKAYKVVYKCITSTQTFPVATHFFDDAQEIVESIKTELTYNRNRIVVYIYTNQVTPTLLCSILPYENSTLAEVRKGGSPLVSKIISIKDMDEDLFWMEDNELKKEKPIKPIAKYDLTDDGEGKKYDTGKSMVGTLCRVFPRALLGVGKCITFGTKKYPNPKNWSLVENGFNRYTDSLMRHLLKMFAGQEVDPETNLPHIFHVCWNALAIAEFYLMEHREIDEELFE